MYNSTREKLNISASKAILNGLGPKGGLYVFDVLDNNFFDEGFISMSYREIAKAVFKLLLDDYQDDEIDYIIHQAYEQKKFIPQPAVLKTYHKLSFLELFHGETFAFKDIALSALPYMIEIAKKIQKINKKSVILTATSGDTGSATLSGFKDLSDVFVIVLYPKHGISLFQEKQMHHLKNNHTLLVPIDGNFDDCQKIVKEVLETTKLNRLMMTSANSINIGRIISQIVYYLHAYVELVKQDVIEFKEKINVSVPTGNFGNIYAAYIAKELGVPINKLIIGSNKNKVLFDIFRHHIYRIDRKFYKTVSPSMDILVSSNFERYLYNITKNHGVVENYMKHLNNDKHIDIKELRCSQDFFASTCTDEETMEMIKRVKIKYDYLIDPHTAVAYKAYRDYTLEKKDDIHTLIVSTASPLKFSETVIKSIDQNEISELKSRMRYLEGVAPYLADYRVKLVLEAQVEPIIYKVHEAKEKIKKVLGDLDADY